MSIESKTLTGALGSVSERKNKQPNKQTKPKQNQHQTRMVGQFIVRPKRSRQNKSNLKATRNPAK